MIDKNDTNKHLYEIITEDLIEKINDDHFGQSGRLPNYLQLTEMYDVSMSTIKKAMQLLNDKGYLVSRVGKGTFINKKLLRFNKTEVAPTNKIAFALINYNDANFFDILTEVEKLTKKLNKNLEVHVSKTINAHEELISKLVSNKEVDGLILGTSRKSVFGVKLYKKILKQVPAFFCHDIYDSNVPIVTIDNYKVGSLAACELLKKSEKKICIVLDENGYKSDDLKLEGFLDELESQGESGRCVVIRNSFKNKGSTYEDGFNIGNVLDLENSEIDAIFASNDEVARGFKNALIEKGYNFPQDISILGFGNVKQTQEHDSSLNTIGIDSKELGKVLFNNFKIIFEENEYKVPSKVLIEPKLIIREKN